MMQHWTALGSSDTRRSEALLAKIDEDYRSMSPQEMLDAATDALHFAGDEPSLRCRALKEQSNALRDLGDFAGALRALDDADQQATLTHAPGHEAAILTWARAMVMWQTGYCERARRLIRDACSVFRSYGDTVRADRAGQLVAAILYDEGRHEEAHREYQAHLRAARDKGDSLALIDAYGNIAICYARMHDNALARLNFWIAARGYTRLGLTRSRGNMMRGLARLDIIETGVRGLPAIQATRDQFEALGMRQAMVITDIMTVEALLENDRQADVTELCRRIVNEGTAIGLRAAAATALALLAEKAEAHRATPDLAHQVELVFAGQRPSVDFTQIAF